MYVRRLRSLRGQLAVAYSVALIVGLVAFAFGTFTTVHEMRRATLDDRIDTAVRALIGLTAASDGRIVLPATDATRFARIVGDRLNGAVIERDGTVVASSGAVPRELRALAMHPPAALAMLTLTLGAAPSRAAVTPVPRRAAPLGIAVVWRELDGTADVERRLALLFALAIPLLGLFAVLAGNLVAERGLRPLRRLAQLASEIEASDLSQRLDVRRDDELGRLCAAFDRMLERLEGAFERERRFTSDASHELRAPLSVIRAEVELALRRDRSWDYCERTFRAIGAQTEKLERLASELLTLARMDERARVVTGAAFDAAAAAAAVGEEFAPLARSRGIALAVDASFAAFVLGREAEFERALATLLDNALKSGATHVRIRVGPGADPTLIEAAVEDDGPGFSPAGLQNATRRFWRDRTAGERAPGSGLGLAIAEATALRHGGSLQLANLPDGGASVALVVPRALEGGEQRGAFGEEPLLVHLGMGEVEEAHRP